MICGLDVTISCMALVCVRSVSAGFTDVSSLVVAAFDLVYCSLSGIKNVYDK